MVQIPGTGALVHANTPSRLNAVTRNEDAAWQAMSEAMSPNKVKAVRRLPHSFVRGGFLSDMGRKVTVPFQG